MDPAPDARLVHVEIVDGRPFKRIRTSGPRSAGLSENCGLVIVRDEDTELEKL